MILKGITQIGKKHIEMGTVCQDSVEVYHANGLIAISVSDGAGSRKFSHLGSQFITKLMIKMIPETFHEWLNLIAEDRFADFFDVWIARHINDEVSRLNKERDADDFLTKEDLASTLVFYAERDNKAFLIHVGDGVIIGLNKEYRMEILSYPENGEFSNVTFFVTSPQNQDHIRTKIIDPQDFFSVFCMTDGAEDIYLDKMNRKVIKGLYYVVIDAIKRQDAFFNDFKRFLAEETSPIIEDDIGMGLLVKNEMLDLILLEERFNEIVVSKQEEQSDTKHIVLSSKEKEIDAEKQSQRNRSNALNPKHFSYYTARGYSKIDAIRKAKEYKGFLKSPGQREKEKKSIVHVCNNCLSDNVEKIIVYLKDEEGNFIGEYTAKKCNDCGEVTILYRNNIQ
jgi:hypothetical protein